MKNHFSFCLHLGPRFTGRRADHQALGWRVEPRQRWTRCIARRDEGGHRNHEPKVPLARAADPHPAVTPALLAQTPQSASITRARPSNPGAVKDGVNKR